MEKGQSQREGITTSTSQKKKKKKKRKQQDLRVEVLKKNMLERFHSEEAAFWAYKSSPVKPGPSTGAASTVVSKWARDADNDLRALILCKRSCCNSKAGAEAPVVIVEEMRETPQKGCHYSSEKETRRQLKRKSTDAGGGPALKRRKPMLLTSTSLEDPEALGNTTSRRCSDLPKNEEEIISDDKDCVLILESDEDLLMEVDVLLGHFTL